MTDKALHHGQYGCMTMQVNQPCGPRPRNRTSFRRHAAFADRPSAPAGERAQQETPPGEASYGLRLNASINSPPGAPWMTRALRHSHLWIKGRVSEWLELYLAASGRSDTAPTPPGLGASHAFQIYPASGCSRY
jgi:hypothetical protein